MFLVPFAIFIVIASGFSLVWNRLFPLVPRRVIVFFVALVSLYQAETFFTPRVDLPGDLAYHAYPWKGLGHEPAAANTGIIFTQMIPWTETARRDVRAGEAPLWNRTIGGGSPLLANLQTTIAHPFTLIGVPLHLGDAWTLSIALRLFFSLFFLYVFLMQWGVSSLAAIFGTVAYTFSTFHIVALLFPLGLSMMSLPIALAAADLLLRSPSRRTFTLVIVALSMAVLGGHPESTAWVSLTTGAYALYFAAVELRPGSVAIRRLALAALAAISAAALTSFFWYPAIKILPHTERFAALSTTDSGTDHGIGADWLVTLLAPNILGTPQAGNYRQPNPTHAAVPSDYGEVASGYAGAVTLALAIASLFLPRRRPFWFFAGAALVGFLTIYETPGWYHMIREIPWIGIALHQRWRFLWVLGVCGAASLALDFVLRSSDRQVAVRRGLVAAAGLIGAMYFLRLKEFIARDVLAFQLVQLTVTLLALALAFFAMRLAARSNRLESFAVAATALTFLELALLTLRYNPPTSKERLMPETPAITAMKQSPPPYRVAALSWSFIPDTPGFYGLEDVKTTDVVQYRQYLRLYRGYLGIDRNDFSQEIQRVDYPFFDFLNVRFLYAPPNIDFSHPTFDRVYDGKDGKVFRNREELPRYFIVPQFEIEPNFDNTVARLKHITDLRQRAVVDHVPEKMIRMAGPNPQLGGGGEVRIREYGSRSATLDVTSRGWNLLVSSDVNMPGWRVYWNDERLPPVVVNGAFVGMFVPPGKGVVRMRYLPDEFEDAATVSIMTALLLIAVLLFSRFPKGRVRNASMSEVRPEGAREE